MTNIPDLTNASPGDVYQGPDGRQWEVIAIYNNPIVIMTAWDEAGRMMKKMDHADARCWAEFQKVDG